MIRFLHFTTCAIVLVISCSTLSSQYLFTDKLVIADTEIKSQGNSGTCWSFATLSFLESEAIRATGSGVDLSEMYVVRQNYLDKARNYLLRQGKANFSEGALSHDAIRVISEHGVVPEESYTGLKEGSEKHDHSELVRVLKYTLDGYLQGSPLSGEWYPVVNCILDTYLGPVPSEFTYNGKEYTPLSFAQAIDVATDDYVSITSFTHHPFYQYFVLEIPDNFSNGSYFNVSLDELQQVVDLSLEKGYSVAWDGDVSNVGFNAGKSLAILPSDTSRVGIFEVPGAEKQVDQEDRQLQFEALVTTDDHLMHIVGKAVDQNGSPYYIVKNSWGIKGPAAGYLYMSVPYFRMNTIAVMASKSPLPETLREKISLTTAR